MEKMIETQDCGFIKLVAPKGFLITSWREQGDLHLYYSSNEVCLPQGADSTIYHLISLPEDEKYKRMMMEGGTE